MAFETPTPPTPKSCEIARPPFDRQNQGEISAYCKKKTGGPYELTSVNGLIAYCIRLIWKVEWNTGSFISLGNAYGIKVNQVLAEKHGYSIGIVVSAFIQLIDGCVLLSGLSSG